MVARGRSCASHHNHFLESLLTSFMYLEIYFIVLIGMNRTDRKWFTRQCRRSRGKYPQNPTRTKRFGGLVTGKKSSYFIPLGMNRTDRKWFNRQCRSFWCFLSRGKDPHIPTIMRCERHRHAFQFVVKGGRPISCQRSLTLETPPSPPTSRLWYDDGNDERGSHNSNTPVVSSVFRFYWILLFTPNRCLHQVCLLTIGN